MAEDKETQAPSWAGALPILAHLEARYKFVTTSAYVRTYHNTTNDWLTRETEDVIQRGMRQAGFCELDPLVGWGQRLKLHV